MFKKVLSLVLVLSIVFGVTSLAVACGQTPEENKVNTISLLKNTDEDEWHDYNFEDGNPLNSNAGMFAFKLSSGENALSPIKSQKYGEYDCIFKNVGALRNEYKDFTSYKKLVVVARLATPAENPVSLIVKFESYPQLPGSFAEINIPLFLDEDETFEFDLSFDTYADVRAGLKRILLFPNAGLLGEDLPDIYISKLEFSKEAPNPTYVLNEQAKTIATPNAYDGVSNEFDINKNFISHDGETAYLVSWEEGVTTIRVNDGKGAWSYINSPVTGNVQGFTGLYIRYSGTAGAKFKLKLEGASANIETGDGVPTAENNADRICNGEEQEYTWRGFTSANLTNGPEMMVLIFLEPNIGGADAYDHFLEIYEFKFIK